jgi:copper(I)-binding protein
MTRFTPLACAAAFSALIAAFPAAAQMTGGHDHGGDHMKTMASGVTITAPWARASAGRARNGAAYVVLQKAGGADDRLVAAEAAVAGRVELHSHLMENGVLRMRQVKGGIPVPAGKMVTLKPGGLHIMFMGLKAPFKEGETFPLTLVFEKAGKKTVEVKVKGVGAMGPGGGMGGGMGRHGH